MNNDEDNGGSVLLWQLQQYQLVIRKWQPHLSSNEFGIVMQILDRTVGWRRLEATFRSAKMLEGDRMYGGLGLAMSRSTMMKALRVLEDRDVVRRRRDDDRPWLREYSINLEWIPDTAWGAEELSVSLSGAEGVSQGDPPVQQPHQLVPHGDMSVSHRDPREGYQDNGNGERYLDDSRRADPSPPAPDPLSLSMPRGPGEVEAAPETPEQPLTGRFPNTNPAPRKRPSAD